MYNLRQTPATSEQLLKGVIEFNTNSRHVITNLYDIADKFGDNVGGNYRQKLAKMLALHIHILLDAGSTVLINNNTMFDAYLKDACEYYNFRVIHPHHLNFISTEFLYD